MKLTYFLWGYPHDQSIIRAFESQGFIVETIEFLKEYAVNTHSENMEIIKKENSFIDIKEIMENRLNNCSGDIFFSVNFHSLISNFCQKKGIPYCSWVLQLPNYDLYKKEIYNTCNYIGICDSYLVEKMWMQGLSKVFFLPDAVELKEKREEDYREREFCFIARQPENILSIQEMSLYNKGYLDSVIHAQRVLYGCSILENGLPKRVHGEMLACNPVPDEILVQLRNMYIADCYLAPICTNMQQNIVVKNNENLMTVYSNGSFEMCEITKYPYVEDERKRWEIYGNKEFSLVLAPHVLHNGIPRDTLEVIAAGGFPICGFQKDYGYFFKRDEDLVYFTNSIDFQQAVVRYGNHPEERLRVKENAYNLVAQGHTYYHRIVHMLEMWDKL